MRLQKGRSVARKTGGRGSTSQLNLVQRLTRMLHQEMAGSSRGEPLSALVLRYLGAQAVVAACKETYDWACVNDRRICLRLNDARGPPYAPLDRLVGDLVDSLHFSREGRTNVQEHARIMVACKRATTLCSEYCSLAGLGLELDWRDGLRPCLGLRRLRIRQCELTTGDACQLLRCAQGLEVVVFVGENLHGIADELQGVPTLCPTLRSLECTDCNLDGQDAAALLQASPELRMVHFQGMDLSGFKMPPKLQLEILSMLDCQLTRRSVIRIMTLCPDIETLKLCGNSLSAIHEEDAQVPWPSLPRLRHADFRLCELEPGDEEELLRSFPAGSTLEFRAFGLEQSTRGISQRHVLFESSDESSDDQD